MYKGNISQTTSIVIMDIARSAKKNNIYIKGYGSAAIMDIAIMKLNTSKRSKTSKRCQISKFTHWKIQCRYPFLFFTF